jgi:hypothetical protein
VEAPPHDGSAAADLEDARLTLDTLDISLVASARALAGVAFAAFAPLTAGERENNKSASRKTAIDHRTNLDRQTTIITPNR